MTKRQRIDNSQKPSRVTYRYFAPRGGWRYVILFRRGRKWLRLLDTATFEIHTVPVSNRYRLKPFRIARRSLAARLGERRDAFRRHGRRFSERAVKAAIRTLRQTQKPPPD